MSDLPRYTGDEFLAMLAGDYWKRCLGRNLATAGALCEAFELGFQIAHPKATRATIWEPNVKGRPSSERGP